MNKRDCTECGKTIPWKFRIEDKYYQISRSRKKCLECSPFRQWQTPDNNYTPVKRTYGNSSEKRKEAIKASLYKRALTRKEELIAEHGGCCQNCGYKKSRRALTFHHLDPSAKLFGLSLPMLWSKSEEDIKKESAKCILLCMNCHAETEDAIKQENKTSIVQKVNTKYGTSF
jgi:5-methylcytosine-specific restriction endonuclease McrA